MRFQQTFLGGREMPAILYPFGCVLSVVFSILCAGSQPAWASPAITTTTLAVTSAGNAVTTVTPGSVVTLTATVTVSSTPVAPGQINFCDATAKSCTDIHLLGTAQLTSVGTATLKFRPGVGNHRYKAVFVGTTSNAASASAPSALAVATTTGLYPTATLAGTGLQGVIPDLFSSTVTVRGRGTAPPTGTVSIVDTSNTNFVLGTATLTPGPPGLSFLPSRMTVEAPQLIASGDFNGDGISDLAVVGPDLVYLGNGDGTFMAGPATFPTTTTGGTPSSVVVGDFNGDGKTDLVLLDGGVTILLGNGDGTFAMVANPPQVQGVEAATIGDFNGDGNADLAVTDPTSNTVTILFGNGDGTFVTGPLTATGDSPSSVAAGDYNGDGKVDLAVTNQVSNTVTILLGNGDGTFTAAASPATGSGPASIVVGDLNGDGKADLAVTNSTSNTLTILIGNGDGTFTPATSPATDGGSSVVALGDFNGDGTPDLAVAGVNGGAAILVGNGDGTFAAAAGQDSASGGQSIAISDFDGDGLSDLAAAIVVDDGDTVAVSLAETEWATATAYDLSPQGQGTHLIAASYSGDSNYNRSTSAIQAITVNPAFNITASTISSISPGASGTSTLTVAPSDGFTGAVTLSCFVGNHPNAVQPPTCSITPSTLAISGTASVTGLLTINTQATTSVGAYATGAEITTLVNNVAISSQTLNLPFSVGTNPPSRFTLTSSAITITSPGASGTSTLTVTPSGGFTGAVQLGCDVIVSPANTVFPATCAVPPSLAVNGTAPVTTTLTVATQATASAGAYQVEVFASGAAAGLNEGLIVPVTVTVPVPSFALTNTTVSIATPGVSGTSTITVTANGGFTGTVALSCAVTGPAGAVDPPTCAVPAQAAVTGTGAVTVTLTVYTTGAATTAPTGYETKAEKPLKRIFTLGGSAVMSALFLFVIPGRRRRWKSFLSLLFIAFIGGVVIGCGGAANTPPANPGTTLGTYTVTVTGTSGATVQSTAVSVGVN